ncbi:MAG: cation transporter [Candidatus Omnitrophica bacterium]|nr:cation transporter [Candidatus Omnitrophota bacterium]
MSEIRAIFRPKTCIQIGLLTNLGLTVFKFFAGIFGLSQAMLADALHSLSDILTSGVAYAGICIGEKPADKDHPYGHGNAETIAAILVALIVFCIGGYVAFSAISTIVHRHFHAPLTIALFAAIVSIIVKELLFRYTIKVGKISNSPAVIADAWHHRSDAYSSIAALIGIAGAKISFLFLDPLAGLVVSVMIAKIALKLLRANIGIIMDENPHPDFIDKIKTIVQKVEGVRRVDSIRVHRRGPTFTIDLEVAVDGKMTVDQGHAIAVEVRSKLVEQVQYVREVMVHINPYKSYPDS